MEWNGIIIFVISFWQTSVWCCSLTRHLHPENQEVVHWQPSKKESGQHQHRAAGRPEDHGGQYRGGAAERGGPVWYVQRLRAVNVTLLISYSPLYMSSIVFISGSTIFSSLHCSSGLQGQQPVLLIKEVQERRQISEHPLHLCQAGSRGCLFHHANCLRSLLVALKGRQGRYQNGVSWTQSEDATKFNPQP